MGDLSDSADSDGRRKLAGRRFTSLWFQIHDNDIGLNQMVHDSFLLLPQSENRIWHGLKTGLVFKVGRQFMISIIISGWRCRIPVVVNWFTKCPEFSKPWKFAVHTLALVRLHTCVQVQSKYLVIEIKTIYFTARLGGGLIEVNKVLIRTRASKVSVSLWIESEPDGR